MLELVTAVRYAQRLTSGRSRPVLVGCESHAAGTDFEVVLKLSDTGCEIQGIIREALMAMLAADLLLPVPEPFLVDLADGFIEALPPGELQLATHLRRSVFPTFGSKLMKGGFSAWNKEMPIKDELLDQAAEIFAFDALTLNPDRRAQNPNCLCNGTSFAIFDHEYGLGTTGLGTVLLPYPWTSEGLRALIGGSGEHVLYHGVHRRGARLSRLEQAWGRLSEGRLEEYRTALPQSWADDSPHVIEESLMYLRDLQNHLDEAFREVRRVLA